MTYLAQIIPTCKQCDLNPILVPGIQHFDDDAYFSITSRTEIAAGTVSYFNRDPIPYYFSAPCSNNSCATLVYSPEVAIWNAVRPCSPRMCTSAPCASSTRTTSRCPFPDAKRSGVLWDADWALTSALCSRRSSITSTN